MKSKLKKTNSRVREIGQNQGLIDVGRQIMQPYYIDGNAANAVFAGLGTVAREQSEHRTHIINMQDGMNELAQVQEDTTEEVRTLQSQVRQNRRATNANQTNSDRPKRSRWNPFKKKAR